MGKETEAKQGERKDRVKPADIPKQGLYGSGSPASHIFRTTTVVVFTLLFIVLLVLLIWRTISILVLFFAGILVSVLLTFFGGLLSRLMRIPHWLAITLVLLLLLGLLGLLVVLVVPVVAGELDQLSEQIGESLEQVFGWLRETAGGRFLVERMAGFQEQLAADGAIWAQAAGIFSTTVGAVAGLSIILIIGVFLSYSPRLYLTGFLHLVPHDRRLRATEVMEAVGATLRWWLLGQLISMGVLAVSTWIMLTLLGVPLALILALITGLLTFIPYLGPIFAIVPILLIAFLQGPLMALYVLVLYLVIQNIEGNVLMPIVYHKTVHIPPALGVITQILFGSLLGFVGFLLATPLMAVILVLVQKLYVEDVLGEQGSS